MYSSILRQAIQFVSTFSEISAFSLKGGYKITRATRKEARDAKEGRKSEVENRVGRRVSVSIDRVAEIDVRTDEYLVQRSAGSRPPGCTRD